jgi:sphinganine-1-phosphate aldolase
MMMITFDFSVHICLTQLHTLPGVADRFINDVKEEVKKILKNPEDDLEGKVSVIDVQSFSKLE